MVRLLFLKNTGGLFRTFGMTPQYFDKFCVNLSNKINYFTKFKYH